MSIALLAWDAGAQPEAETHARQTPVVETGDSPPLSTLDYGWQRGEPVMEARPSVVVDEPKTSGMPGEVVQTSAKLALGLGTAMFTCPIDIDGCTATPGWVAGAALLLRPAPWFSWGVSLEAQRYSRTWSMRGGDSWLARQHVYSGKLVAQVHVPNLGVVDPYVGISLGGAAIAERIRGQNATTDQTWLGSPLYGARAGLGVRVSDGIELGALIDWTNIRANTGENCPWAVGGVCSANNWSAFAPSDALWNVSATVSFAFGEEL